MSERDRDRDEYEEYLEAARRSAGGPEEPTQDPDDGKGETPYPIATLPESPSGIVPYARASELRLSKDEQEALMAPTDPADVLFKWGDRKKSFALAYVPQVLYRRRLNKILGAGQWTLVPLGAKIDGSTVYYHGALYVRGCFVSEAWGEQEFQGANRNDSYPTAHEGAKSDCLTRCCKDLSMFDDCWDKRFTRPLEEAWRKANSPKCPVCGKIQWLNEDRSSGEWYCWKNPKAGKEGCGWRGAKPEPVGSHPQAADSAARPPQAEPAVAPGAGDPVEDHPSRKIKPPARQARDRAMNEPGPDWPQPAPGVERAMKLYAPAPEDDLPQPISDQAVAEVECFDKVKPGTLARVNACLRQFNLETQREWAKSLLEKPTEERMQRAIVKLQDRLNARKGVE